MIMKKITYIFSALAFLMLLVAGCSTEDLEPTLAQEKVVEGSITSDQDMFGVLKGALNRMTASSYYGRNFIINDEVRTDNCFANGSSGRFQTLAFFDYNAGSDPGIWAQGYRVIAVANILAGVDTGSIQGDTGYAEHIQGQAHFLRALVHFDLMKNYGQQYTGGNLGVPIVTQFKTGDLTPPRNTIDEVKAFIYDELATAFTKMNDNYNISEEYPTKYAAKALESSVAIYFGDWGRAKTAAKAVMDSGQYSIVPAAGYVDSFANDNAVNSVFEIANSDIDNANINGLGYIYRGPNYGDIEVMDEVENLYESGDVRADILGYEGTMLRNMGKYPSSLGYDNISIIRYEEVVLNYAEALLEDGGGDVAGALNMLTAKRGASAYTAPVTKDDVLNERRKELIFEGFRYNDLIRTGHDVPKKSIDNIVEMIPNGGNKTIFPIPTAELDANSNMVQNNGY